MITRRSLLAAGTLGSAGIMAGCGSGTPGQSADEERAAKASGGGPVTIQFWKGKLTNVEDAWYVKVVEQFNQAQQKVKVVLTQVPGDSWESKLKAAQAAGKAPDVYFKSGNNVAVDVRNGEIADLTDLIPQAAWDDLDDNAEKLVTVDGKKYSYPMLWEPQTLLFYRKDIFSDAGLDPEQPPKSWADLLSMGAKVKAQGRFALLMGVTKGDLAWQGWGWQRNVAGYLPISDDWTTARATDPAFAKLAQFYRDLYDNELIPKQALAPANDGTPFGQGKAAMMVQGSWGTTQLLDEFEKLAPNVGVAPLPTHDGNGVVPVTSGNMHWVIDAKSTKKAETAEFITWLLASEDPAVMLDYFKSTSYSKTSPRKSIVTATANIADADTVNPWRKVISDVVIPTGALEPSYDWQVAEAFGEGMERAMRGADIASTLAETNKKMNELIKKLDLPSKVIK